MRKTRLLILLFLFSIFYSSIEAQTPIQGIINTYHKVTSIDYTTSSVVVDDPGDLGPGDKVMLVQMKGASVSTSNNSAFGDTTSLNNAGNYELGTVCTVEGNTVYLLNTILRQYTIAGKVQLVYIPVYDNAVVTDSLKAAPWNNNTGTGGVLALHVTYSLFLSAPVSATGAGFKGGSPVLSSGTCADWAPASGQYYTASNTNPQMGAYKGEAVWEPTLASYTGGKAAVANGGGGGNNHNNGGGGGANLSAGGTGGGNNSSTVCTVSNPGEGGNALSSYGGTKIFLGGGGGAGHVNTGGILKGGGDGGGMVYIKAQSLMSGGQTISANGLNGGNAIGDGASGGGAGGTILMNVDLYTDAVNVESLGGDGGQVDNEFINYKCYGEGGGGSGGVVYLKNALAPGAINVSGGIKGAKINSMSNCNPQVPGGAGTIGASSAGFTPLQSSVISSSCTFVLPTTLLFFKTNVANSDVTNHWQVAQPELINTFIVERQQLGETWKEVAMVAAREGVDVYTAQDRGLPNGRYTYRLKMIEKSGAIIYSGIQRVTISSKGTATLNVFPNPAKGTLHILLPSEAANELKVFDFSGRLLIHNYIAGSSRVLSQDVSSLKAGLYVLRIGMLQKVFRIQ